MSHHTLVCSDNGSLAQFLSISACKLTVATGADQVMIGDEIKFDKAGQ